MSITVYEGTVKHELPFEEGENVLSVLQRRLYGRYAF